MCTLLLSLGKLADTISQLDLPSEYVICALQTGITVISDDLDLVLEGDASPEPDGMSYVWWEANIVRPLILASKRRCVSAEITVAPKTQTLLQFMDQLAENPLGFAVQLHVGESIGVDMVLFLLTLFSKVEVNGQKIFQSSEILSWITAHIVDEAISDRKTVYEEKDTINIVAEANQQDLFLLAEEYMNCWREALDELHGFLNEVVVTDDCVDVACHLL